MVIVEFELLGKAVATDNLRYNLKRVTSYLALRGTEETELQLEVTIRKSRPGDVKDLYEVWKTAIEATHNFVSPKDKERISKLVLESYLPQTDLDLAVDANQKPLAFMGMSGNEIDSLFVHADARGKSLGRILVELAFSRAPLIRTEVNEQNHQAIAFWRHMGFKTTGRTETDRGGRPYPLLLMEWVEA